MEKPRGIKITNIDKQKQCDIHGVMCRFSFKYKCLNRNYQVEVNAETLNKAMLDFTTYYHDIQEVYSIIRVS